MKTLTQQDVKKSEIETLRIFRNFCEKNDLRYFLTFGTLLGAVRHKGFIPWDDDVDVFMPRKDYNFLLEHFNDNADDNDCREVISRENNPDFYLNTAKIIDRHTVVHEAWYSLPIGVWIDVFPMDVLPENFFKRQWAVLCFNFLNFFIEYSEYTCRRGRVWYKNLMALFLPLVRPFKPFLEVLRRRKLKKLERNTAGSYYALLYRYFGYGSIGVLPVSLFEPPVKLEFEGEEYDAPGKYDEFLRRCYGDYMTLPPAEQRKSKHSYVCYWAENAKEETK